MITILIFPFNLLSHYLRCLVLADIYLKKEYNVLFLNSEAHNKFVKQHEYKTFPCKHLDAEYAIECAKDFDFSWINQTALERTMLSQISAISAFKADVVIGDMTLSLNMAAECTGVKYFSLMNGYMTKYYTLTRKCSRSHKAYDILKKMPESLADELTDFGEKLAFKRVHRPFAKIREKHNLKKMNNYLDEIEGDYNLICDLPQLFPQKSLPSNYSYTGPLIYNHFQNNGPWLNKIDEQLKPIIFVCMGSTGEWSKLKFLNNLYFKKYTIITAGDSKKILSGSHIISRAFAHISKVLKKASLMICHGGNGTIYHGIFNNVYMLCLSSHFEQEWNILALEEHGYGKSANDYDSTTWRTKIDEIIDKHVAKGRAPYRERIEKSGNGFFK